jgi:hypothetical protein
MPVLWSALLSNTKEAKEAKSTQMREVELAWYCNGKNLNTEFITDTCTKLAEEHDCDLINIRADVHKTKTAWIAAPSGPRAADKGRRGGRTGTSRPGTTLIKTIEPAPWHITIELHNMNTKQWRGGHVYMETKEVILDGKVMEGIATGELSKPDGKDIPTNPELFNNHRNCHTKAHAWQKSTFVDVPDKFAKK